jgi:hypothetical protein
LESYLINEAASFETFIEHIAGNPLDVGYANEGFINVTIQSVVSFDNPLCLFLIYLQTVNEVIPFLEYAFNQDH